MTEKDKERLEWFKNYAPFEFYGVPLADERSSWNETDWLVWLMTGEEPKSNSPVSSLEVSP